MLKPSLDPRWCLQCKGLLVRRPKERTSDWKIRKYCSKRCSEIAWRGTKFTEEHKSKIGRANRGKVRDENARAKFRLAWKLRRGPRMAQAREARIQAWVTSSLAGNLTYLDAKAMQNTSTYWAWRKQIRARDGDRCVFCSSTVDLEIDHILPVRLYPNLVMDPNNVRTLCFQCHSQTPTYGWHGMYAWAA